jgi:hypothetical protein
VVAVSFYFNRPYDVQYRWDEEKLYCSELVYKAYERASGESLGQRVTLGELNWQPYQSTIEHFEKGPPPLDRAMITPRGLAEARHLEVVFRFEL